MLICLMCLIGSLTGGDVTERGASMAGKAG